MAVYEIPITASPQKTTVNLAGTDRVLTTAWCDPAQCWILSIDNVDGTNVIDGMPMVTGVDLLGQYAYLGIGGSIFVQSLSDPSRVPGYSTLATDGLVFFWTP